MAEGRIQLSATLDSIAAKKNGTIVQLVLDGYVPGEDVADLYRMRGKTVAVPDRGPRPAPPARVRGRRRGARAPRHRAGAGGVAMGAEAYKLMAAVVLGAAVKVLEEASEVHGAWDVYESTHEDDEPVMNKWLLNDLADELADCITACCNLAERYGLDMQDALDRVEQKNVERGRYD